MMSRRSWWYDGWEGRGHAVPRRWWWHLPGGEWVAGDNGALLIVGWRAAFWRVGLFVVL